MLHVSAIHGRPVSLFSNLPLTMSLQGISYSVNRVSYQQSPQTTLVSQKQFPVVTPQRASASAWHMAPKQGCHSHSSGHDSNEIKLMQAKQLSSVFRQMKNARLAVQCVIRHYEPGQLVGALILYPGDCLPIDPSFCRRWAEVFAEIRQLFTFAAQHDVHVATKPAGKQDQTRLHSPHCS